MVLPMQRGFGLPLSQEELKGINEKKVLKQLEPVKESPGRGFFEFGINRQGYWNHDLFAKQVESVLDCMEHIYPERQLLIEVDRSSEHMKYADHALDANDLNLTWDGKQRIMHPSQIKDASYLGNRAERILQVGDLQHFQFQEGDSNLHDTIPMQNPTIAKSLKQILWERGLYVDGRQCHQTDSRYEKSTRETTRGTFSWRNVPYNKLLKIVVIFVYLLLSAILRWQDMVEYCWGYSETMFRRINDRIVANLQINGK